MSEPFLGEIRLFSFPIAPQGWAFCNGQLLMIQQYQALYSLLGTTYGGDGRTTFALPDLRGRTPVHLGNGVTRGQSAGAEICALSVGEMPAHTHVAMAGSSAVSEKPADHVWGQPAANFYGDAPNASMLTAAIAPAGGGQAHLNMQPYCTLNFCIALTGYYPPRN